MALLLVVHLVEEAPSVRRLASHLGVGKPIVSRALDTLKKWAIYADGAGFGIDETFSSSEPRKVHPFSPS